METQVQKQHYAGENYLTEDRFASFNFLLRFVLNRGYKNIAEIGKGSGIFAALLKNFGIKVTTIDYAKDLEPDILCDLRKLDDINQVFDCVVCAQVLEHLPFDDFQNAVQSLCSIAKFGVILTIPDRRYYLGGYFKLPGLREKRIRIIVDPIFQTIV